METLERLQLFAGMIRKIYGIIFFLGTGRSTVFFFIEGKEQKSAIYRGASGFRDRCRTIEE